MTIPVLAIPNPALILSPVDAVLAAITTFISGQFGVEATNGSFNSDELTFIDEAIAFIKAGDESFAAAMADLVHEMTEDDGPVHMSFALAMSMGAEAGVYSAKGDAIAAWRRASFSAILFGVLAGAAVKDKGGLRAVMTSLSEKGVDARHAKMRELKAFATARYREKKWPSANAAAHALMGDVMAEADRIGARLMPSNAQRTLAEWFRAAGKEGDD